MPHRLKPSELVLNPDGSIYHLNLHPDEIADTIFLVGDPDRVEAVSNYFDHVDVRKQKREYITHTGTIGSKKFSVVSTGIGSGGIDIVLNELDALANIDLKNRVVKNTFKKLRFIRLGTSGALQSDIPVDDCVVSTYGIGLDGTVLYYDWKNTINEEKILRQCHEKFSSMPIVDAMYVAEASASLVQLFEKNKMGFLGITLTCPGFYGAQNRHLRAPLARDNLFSSALQLKFENQVITNLEMETAAIYGLSRLLQHEACSISTIIANRDKQIFSKNPEKAVDLMIQKAVAILSNQ